VKLALHVIGIATGLAVAPSAALAPSAATALSPAFTPRGALASAPGDVPAQYAEAKSLLDANRAPDALAKAKVGLEYAPDNIELLDLASRAAAAAGDNDQALWYASLAVEQAAPGKEKQIAEIQKRAAELDPLQGKNQAVIGAYAQALLAVGEKCASKKLYATAVELFQRCKGTPAAAQAEVELGKIYDNKPAVEALLDSGVDVPIKAKKKRSAAAVAKEDKKHATWATAYQIKGKCYTIITDMGSDMAEQISLAMEQINRFYRKMFHIKEQGGDTAHVTIKVFRTRAEFDAHARDKGDPVMAPGVKGFFVASANKVCTYDTREEGFPPSFLWSTLFHESSHQFTSLTFFGNPVPTWLNEGTASYFEGARLRSNGTVETNLVADLRLTELKIHLDEGNPTLADVVSYPKQGSYPGEYYPFGWGLAYFLNNYEDDKSVRVYKPIYHEYMLSYKSGNPPDPMARFVEYFVTKAKQPGVASFADFEKRWKAWILALFDIQYGGRDKADVLLARARKQRADKQPEAALDSYRWALRKRPGDLRATYELAELLSEMKRDDAALLNFQRARAIARSLEDRAKPVASGDTTTAAEIIDKASARISQIDKTANDSLNAADAALLAAALETAKAYAEAKLPMTALRLIDQSQGSMGVTSELQKLRAEIAKSSNADTRRWRRVAIGADLAEWEAGEGWSAQGESLVASSESLGQCFWNEELPDRYGFQVRTDASQLDKGSVIGIAFGAAGSSLQVLAIYPDGDIVAIEVKKGGVKVVKQVGHVDKAQLASVVIGIEVSQGSVEFTLDGKSAAKRDYPPDDLEGAVGLVIYKGKGTFSEIKWHD
jgi:hypothetical protein